MSADLSFIKSDVKLSEVKPIDRRQTAVTVNCTILAVTKVLNDFSERAENIIFKAEKMLRNCDIKLKILEEKLSNVVIEEFSEENLKKVDNPVVLDKQVEIETEVNEKSTNALESSSLIREDPRYSKYFKMLKMGVLEQAVKLKMQSEGVDPNILERGDEVLSPSCKNADSDASSSSFSDSD